MQFLNLPAGVTIYATHREETGCNYLFVLIGFIYSWACVLPLSPCDRPRVIESLRGVEVVDIAAGGAHSACITASGELYTWGKGRYGRLGHGDSEDQLKPKLVSVQLCV